MNISRMRNTGRIQQSQLPRPLRNPRLNRSQVNHFKKLSNIYTRSKSRASEFDHSKEKLIKFHEYRNYKKQAFQRSSRGMFYPPSMSSLVDNIHFCFKETNFYREKTKQQPKILVSSKSGQTDKKTRISKTPLRISRRPLQEIVGLQEPEGEDVEEIDKNRF